MTKKILFIGIIFLSNLTISQSQEFDEEYLESLPEDVREDLLDRVDKKEASEDPTYRIASSSIDKKTEDLDEEEIIDEGTQLFGSNFFDTMQTSFMPINEPNLDSKYILDFGDVLEIQLIGQEDSIDSYRISRDGSINIPNVGKIILSGLSLGDASDFIKAKINNVYIGTESFVSLKNIRDISILIAGNAFNPGIYTLNGNSNMLHALNMAGGINEIGSYRDISLVRNGEVIDTLDIYELLIYGKYNFKNGLRSGDSIVVNPLKKVVAIESGVMRPALYELKDDEGFEDLLRFANGLSKNTVKDIAYVKRFTDGKSTLINLKYEDLELFDLNENDSIFFTEYKVYSVTINGAVRNPGKYNISLGTKLSELINFAGGYDEVAYPFGGYLENKKTLEINKNAKEKLYEKFIDNLVINAGSMNTDDPNVTLLLSQLKDSSVSGRVIAEFDIDVIKSNPSLDTILEDGDRILIPNITQQVYIQGEISNPGAIRYSPGKNIDYYINGAGGALDSSDLNNIFIVHPNGETSNISSTGRLSFINAQNDKILIYPGSIIYVPRNTNFANSLQVASIWAPIISSIALSLTSLSVLNNSN